VGFRKSKLCCGGLLLGGSELGGVLAKSFVGEFDHDVQLAVDARKTFWHGWRRITVVAIGIWPARDLMLDPL
jgi:hypothetical protein